MIFRVVGRANSEPMPVLTHEQVKSISKIDKRCGLAENRTLVQANSHKGFYLPDETYLALITKSPCRQYKRTGGKKN
jgi:hypothetical protein